MKKIRTMKAEPIPSSRALSASSWWGWTHGCSTLDIDELR